MHDGMPCDPIQGQGQGHGTSEVPKIALFSLPPPPFGDFAWLGSVLEFISLLWCSDTTTVLPQPFYGPFSGTTRVSWCQKRTSGLYGAIKNAQIFFQQNFSSYLKNTSRHKIDYKNHKLLPITNCDIR